MIEKLYREKWTVLDGVGGLVLLPTRELALQVFEVFRQISKFHEFSFGLIVGGKSVKNEKSMLNQMNILICTPGRLLQHLEETVGFHLDNLQFLVIDEADEVLSMGFEESVTQILESVPQSTQVFFLKFFDYAKETIIIC